MCLSPGVLPSFSSDTVYSNTELLLWTSCWKIRLPSLKASLSFSREIYSSSGCMCQISFIAALTTARASVMCALWGQWPLYCSPLWRTLNNGPSQEKRKQSEWVSLSVFVLVVFIRQEGWLINALAMCSCSCMKGDWHIYKVYTR